MKKTITLTVFSLLLASLTQAQHARFGINAGANFASMHSEADNETDNSKTKFGITGGIVIDKPFSTHFIFQPELNWTQKGGVSNASSDAKIILNYIEVPLKLLYRSHSTYGFFIGAGPSFSYGISGKAKYQDLGIDIHFGNGEQDDMKAVDIGAHFTAGYLTQNGLQVGLAYNKGLSNLSIEQGGNSIVRNNYFGLRLAYFFKSNKAK